ncbi:hypothetical protein FRC06_011915 [Ceratobasidium sp. 370]|nr:hypothetical protein FRC06_011915 [Ceratobasidium sp. 370]
MPIPARIQERLENSMSAEEDEEHFDDTISGSMGDVLSADPQLAASQVPAGADSWYIRRALGPILKRAVPDDDRSARDITPWHLIPQVLNALARVELTRLKVIEEATRALELNENLRKEKRGAGEGSDEALLLPSDKKKELRGLINPKTCAFLRQNYTFISLQMRVVHIYEDIRARAAGVDELIMAYFPQDLTAPSPHLFIHSMKTASSDEFKSYAATRVSVYDLYREVDEWEDELKESISESVMNGLQDTNLKFSYPEEFGKKFQPTVSWLQVLKMVFGWCRTVQNMVNTLEKIFK